MDCGKTSGSIPDQGIEPIEGTTRILEQGLCGSEIEVQNDCEAAARIIEQCGVVTAARRRPNSRATSKWTQGECFRFQLFGISAVLLAIRKSRTDVGSRPVRFLIAGDTVA